MGNMELAFLIESIKNYNLEQAVTLMEQVQLRLNETKQQIENCSLDNVVRMLDLMDSENNLEIAWDIIGERVDELIEEKSERMFMVLEYLKEI